jgi:hypothetical protein
MTGLEGGDGLHQLVDPCGGCPQRAQSPRRPLLDHDLAVALAPCGRLGTESGEARQLLAAAPLPSLALPSGRLAAALLLMAAPSLPFLAAAGLLQAAVGSSVSQEAAGPLALLAELHRI